MFYLYRVEVEFDVADDGWDSLEFKIVAQSAILAIYEAEDIFRTTVTGKVGRVVVVEQMERVDAFPGTVK